MTNKIQLLLILFINKPESWGEILPAPNPNIVYLARGTSLISQFPLFSCAYELWFELDKIPLERSIAGQAHLAQLRMILQIIFDIGSVDHVSWRFKESDRWDDYWNLIHDLAVVSKYGSEDLRFNFQKVLSVIEVRTVANADEYLKLKKSWKKW